VFPGCDISELFPVPYDLEPVAAKCPPNGTDRGVVVNTEADGKAAGRARSEADWLKTRFEIEIQ